MTDNYGFTVRHYRTAQDEPYSVVTLWRVDQDNVCHMVDQATAETSVEGHRVIRGRQTLDLRDASTVLYALELRPHRPTVASLFLASLSAVLGG